MAACSRWRCRSGGGIRFDIEIIRSILEGGWDKTSGRALNYWWGMSSDAGGRSEYTLGLPGGTLQMLDLMEKQLREGGLQIFPAEIYAQGHILHSPAGLAYTPAELMEMDWLDECVEGEMPRYEQLDVRTRTLIGSTAWTMSKTAHNNAGVCNLLRIPVGKGSRAALLRDA